MLGENDMRPATAMIIGLMLGVTALSSLVEGQTSLDKLFKTLKAVTGTTEGSSPGSANVTQGLKEALRVGTEKAVSRTSQTDGFFSNPLIKIVMPEKFQSVEKGLRLAGYGSTVDEFVLSMNRAAEAAAPQAQQIFVNAITSMSFADANKIFQGGDTAATDFFKAKTSQDLYSSFRPVVERNLDKVGTVQKYNSLVGQANKVPFMKSQNLDVGDYVTNQALDGLFRVVAEEEKGIRTNPAARVTPLLKEVFGN
jgi:hypothetical protein